jgi:hypothetical protein
MFWSRITPRVACTTNDVASNCFSSDEFSIKRLPATHASSLSILQFK